MLTVLEEAGQAGTLIGDLGQADTILSIICSILMLLGGAWGLWKKFISPYRSYSSFVDSVYTKEYRKAVSHYYVSTRAQDVDPCEQEEIRENNGKFFSVLLIPFFMKEAFSDSSAGRFFLVLADSGMGKTTFLLRLYKECLVSGRFWRRKRVKLISLSSPKCFEHIEAIEDKENTILLLDALDENNDAINNCDEFLKKLIAASCDFKRIVITCRTQFFPSLKDEPFQTGIILPDHRTEIVKKYLAPFSDDEVKKYLKMRFRFNRKLQKKAFKIVQKVPTVMARPLILNWIDLLCDSNSGYKHSFEIYNTIIEKWIERENLAKGDYRLFELSLAIADEMLNAQSTTISAKKVDKIAKSKKLDLRPIIAKSRSLLNRNGKGEYKFAHRSFFEFFVIFGIFQKMRIPDEMTSILHWEGTKRFLLEMLLSSAELSNSEQIACINERLSYHKDVTGCEDVIDFIQNSQLELGYTNSDMGFEVTATAKYNENESANGHNKGIFRIPIREESGQSTYTLHTEALILNLEFHSFTGTTPPMTTVNLNITHKGAVLAKNEDDTE